jgi:hypothetical protein
MPRILHCRACITLFAMAAVCMGTARAHQILYDQDGYRLAVGVEAGLGGFLVGNVDTNAGNVNPTWPIRPCVLRFSQCK